MFFLFFLSSKFMWKNFLSVPLKQPKLMMVASSSDSNLTCLLRVLLITYPVHALVPKMAPQGESTGTLSRPASLFLPGQMFHSVTGLILFKPPHFSLIECPIPSSIIYLPTRNYFIKHLTTFPYVLLSSFVSILIGSKKCIFINTFTITFSYLFL